MAYFNIIAMAEKREFQRNLKLKWIHIYIYIFRRFFNDGKKYVVIFEFWYNYVKRKYKEIQKLCCMGTDSFIVHVKTKNIYEDIAKHTEKRFDTSI